MLHARPTLLSKSYRNAVVNTLGLVAYWRLGDSAGTVVVDEMGKSNGTYTNTPTLGATGLISGDPNTGAIMTRASLESFTASVSYADTFSYAVWYKPASFASYGTLIESNVWVLVSATGQVMCWKNSGGQDVNSGSVLLSVGATAFVVVTNTGTTSAMRMYINGVDVTTPIGNDTLVSVSSVVIGNTPSQGWAVDGTVDEPAIWNRVLTANEVANLYRIGRGF